MCKEAVDIMCCHYFLEVNKLSLSKRQREVPCYRLNRRMITVCK